MNLMASTVRGVLMSSNRTGSTQRTKTLQRADDMALLQMKCCLTANAGFPSFHIYLLPCIHNYFYLTFPFNPFKNYLK